MIVSVSWLEEAFSTTWKDVKAGRVLIGTDRNALDGMVSSPYGRAVKLNPDAVKSANDMAALVHQSALDRRTYFRELLRLQAELVKLQEWVVHTGYKLVVIFEGRDAAGKGGSIKRITQRLYPRVCRTAALPAPTDRENAMVFSTLCTAFTRCR